MFLALAEHIEAGEGQIYLQLMPVNLRYQGRREFGQ